MFSSKPRATIKIQPYQGIFHLHPPSEYPELEEDPDETFWGNVALSLPKPREIKSLVVKLNAHYSVAVPGHSNWYTEHMGMRYFSPSHPREGRTLLRVVLTRPTVQRAVRTMRLRTRVLQAPCRRHRRLSVPQ
ncbi:hypothetical protein EXIGLDRAFT_293530 [Exidia glandulosa HHB12029]|uniref:Uncharacterized protein n=1 Tax=Exidia glandulosa HHB12029 TaxID=1314781 RepID=A0A165M2R0_EXIGL|nr:hypothetical protein EXIGLDRAFT_293530 [Exidia glandulosa HHB12029]